MRVYSGMAISTDLCCCGPKSRHYRNCRSPVQELCACHVALYSSYAVPFFNAVTRCAHPSHVISSCAALQRTDHVRVGSDGHLHRLAETGLG